MAGVLRQCLGCRRLGHWGRTGRCTDCGLDSARAREADPRRRAIKRQRYDAHHRQLRATWAIAVASGEVLCARCELPIDPAKPWDLDHLEDGTSQPSHAACNRAAITRSA